jgi:hypothetical protein
MIIAVVVFAAAIVIAGCGAHSTTDRPSPRPPDPVDPARPERQAQIYAAVLRQYLTSGDAAVAAGHRFPQVFVLDHAVAGAGAPGPGGAGGGPIPPSARRAIVHALTDVGPVTFVASGDEVIVAPRGCAHVRDDGILITLGPVDGAGDQVQVGVNGFLACLGANSLTYRVEQAGGGWMVRGITALGPVA